MRPLFEFVQVSLDGIPLLYGANCITQLGDISKLAEDTPNPTVCVIDKNVEEHQFHGRPLSDTSCEWPPPGHRVVDNDPWFSNIDDFYCLYLSPKFCKSSYTKTLQLVKHSKKEDAYFGVISPSSSWGNEQLQKICNGKAAAFGFWTGSELYHTVLCSVEVTATNITNGTFSVPVKEGGGLNVLLPTFLAGVSFRPVLVQLLHSSEGIFFPIPASTDN